MTKAAIKVTASKKVKGSSKSRIVGEFSPKNFDNEDYDSIEIRANKLYGVDGWDTLSIWETRVACLNVISKRPVRSQRRKKAKA